MIPDIADAYDAYFDRLERMDYAICLLCGKEIYLPATRSWDFWHDEPAHIACIDALSDVGVSEDELQPYRHSDSEEPFILY